MYNYYLLYSLEKFKVKAGISLDGEYKNSVQPLVQEEENRST